MQRTPKNKFVKDVCKYALYAIGVFLLGIYTALEYGYTALEYF